MSAIQIIILLFVLIMWWRLYLKFKANELSLREFLEWFIFWLVVSVLTLVPDTSSYLASVLGVGRGADLVVYFALLIIFYLMFRIFMKLERNERRLTKIVSELAIREKEKDK
ncbi:MAG: DUF2304 domain-containing protein [Patescibacteria group bacterium]